MTILRAEIVGGGADDLPEGYPILIKVGAAASGASPTLPFGQLGELPIVDYGGVAPAAGYLEAGKFYNLTRRQNQLIIPPASPPSAISLSAIAAGLATATVPGNVAMRFGDNQVNTAFRLNTAITALTNGPTGEANYTDDTANFGFNIKGDGSRIDLTKAAVFVQWENKYAQGAPTDPFLLEWHVNFANAAGTIWRPFYSVSPHTGNTGSATVVGGDSIAFVNQAGTVQGQFVSSAFTLSVPTLRATNNVAIGRQINAALDSYKDLPFIDSFDCLKISQSTYIAGTMVATGLGSTSMLALNSSNAVSGGALIKGAFGAALGSGNLYAWDIQASVSASFLASVYNSAAGGHAVYHAMSGTGDALIALDINGASQSWALGVDNSDSDAFVITTDFRALAGTNKWRLDRSGNGTYAGGVSDAVARLQAMPRSTTAALAAIGNAINTANKFANKAVINTTTGLIVTAVDATAAGVWQALDGTTAHTPV